MAITQRISLSAIGGKVLKKKLKSHMDDDDRRPK
jgi:hypothetical protein